MLTSRPRAESQGGAVVVLVALMILPLMMLMAFAIDTGNWWVHKRHLQTQADAGALGGALGPWAPFCDENSIEASARAYAGPNNPQYTPSGSIHVLLNSTNYFENGGSDFSDHPFGASGKPCDLFAASDDNHKAFLDLKVTETGLAKFLSNVVPGLGAVNAHAHARVEIQQVKQENDVRPIAVRDDSYYQCAEAQLWLTDSSGNLTSKFGPLIPLPTRTVLPTDETQFQNPGGSAPITLPSKSNSDPPHLGVQILLGNTNCAATDQYADPSGAVNFINVYQPGLAPGAGAGPKLGGVSMPPASSNCSPDPYFSTNACTAVVKAYVAFAPGGTPSGGGQNEFVTVNGVSATHGSDAGGDYWTASIPIAAQSGPHPMTIAWEQQFGSVGGKTCKKNGNPSQCKGTFGVEQQAFSATDDDSGTNSGKIDFLQIADAGGLFSNSLVQGTTHRFTITVKIQGLANSKPTDPPIIIRNSNQNSKRTGLVDCGQGNGASADHDAIVNGCPLGVYIWPQGTACVVPNANPIDCVTAIPGNRRQKIASAIKDRINGSCNNWNAYRDSNGATPLPVGDPREMTFIITSPADLSGNANGAPIPVLALATFYVTGVDGVKGNGTGCQDEPYPGSGTAKFQFWGHWVKYVPAGGVGNGKGCNPNSFGDCVAVLTQ